MKAKRLAIESVYIRVYKISCDCEQNYFFYENLMYVFTKPSLVVTLKIYAGLVVFALSGYPHDIEIVKSGSIYLNVTDLAQNSM